MRPAAVEHGTHRPLDGQRLTGRKIIVDTRRRRPPRGGAFSGKIRRKSTAPRATPPAGCAKTVVAPDARAAAALAVDVIDLVDAVRNDRWPSRGRCRAVFDLRRPPSSATSTCAGPSTGGPRLRPLRRTTRVQLEKLTRLEDFQAGAGLGARAIAGCSPTSGDRQESTTSFREDAGDVRIGTIVRVRLAGAGRRLGVRCPTNRETRSLEPIAKVTGWDRRRNLIDLAGWAGGGGPAAGRRPATASPPARSWAAAPAGHDRAGDRRGPTTSPRRAVDAGTAGIVRLPPRPTRSRSSRGAALGPVLCFTPSVGKRPGWPNGSATSATRRPRSAGLGQGRGGGSTVVGARPAWPRPGLAAVVRADSHDEATPRSGRDVERSRTSPSNGAAAGRCAVPAGVAVRAARHHRLRSGRAPSRSDERCRMGGRSSGRPHPRRPRTGLFGPGSSDGAQWGRVVCVLNRKGQPPAGLRGVLHWPGAKLRCAVEQRTMGDCRGVAMSARSCAARAGHTAEDVAGRCDRVREELEALAGRPVGEVTSDSDSVPDTPVVVGTERLHRMAPPVDGVAFLDFDQELLAPHTGHRAAMALLVRAADWSGRSAAAGYSCRPGAPPQRSSTRPSMPTPTVWPRVYSERARRAELRSRLFGVGGRVR